LILSDCGKFVNDETIDSLTVCTKLLSLDVGGCDISDAALFSLTSCTSLASLNISFCDVTDASILEIARHCPNLASLELWGCHALTDETFDALRLHCRLLDVEAVRSSWEESLQEDWEDEEQQDENDGLYLNEGVDTHLGDEKEASQGFQVFHFKDNAVLIASESVGSV
jgi:hypothetical protein